VTDVPVSRRETAATARTLAAMIAKSQFMLVTDSVAETNRHPPDEVTPIIRSVERADLVALRAALAGTARRRDAGCAPSRGSA
jgi:hypothetical protein